MQIITVTQLNRYVKSVLEGDKNLTGLFVRGELSNFTLHAASGHGYFTLKDGQSAVQCVFFSRFARDLLFRPENGMQVILQGNTSLYERGGAYQLYVTDIQPEGAGALAVAFAQRKAALEEEGLFDSVHKRPLPPFPRRIGIVTAEGGAALQDILSVLERRFPLCAAVICPAAVQGDRAVPELTAALGLLEREGSCDLIIIGRGGGSAEDLWCFNDPGLARAIFHCSLPVISAVGHETDFTICDFVADLRAPTPSAAAELATPDIRQLESRIRADGTALASGMGKRLALLQGRLRSLQDRPGLVTPMAYVIKNKEKLDFLRKSLYNRKRIIMHGYCGRLSAGARLLDSLSPLGVLDRGYALVYKEGRAVRSIRSLAAGEQVELRLQDGIAWAEIRETETKGVSHGKRYNL